MVGTVGDCEMRLPIRRIGNSQGIILPQAVIAQCGFQEEVEVKVKGGLLVITKPARKPRDGWEEGLRKMAEAGDDKLMIDFPNRFDVEEWEW
jgi:antitoxin MazE